MMVEILWRLRETRRETEKTNLNLQHAEELPYPNPPFPFVACNLAHYPV